MSDEKRRQIAAAKEAAGQAAAAAYCETLMGMLELGTSLDEVLAHGSGHVQEILLEDAGHHVLMRVEWTFSTNGEAIARAVMAVVAGTRSRTAGSA